MSENKNTNVIGIFWIIFIALSFSGLLYLTIFSLNNRSLLVGITALVFSIMWAGSLILGFTFGEDKFDILKYGSFFTNSLLFYTGFIFYVLINMLNKTSGNGNFSIFSINTPTLYSTIASEIPRNIDFILTVFIIPIVEELFWIFGLPVTLFAIMNSLKNKIKLFGNPIFQISVIVIVGAWSFAIFHTGKLSLLLFVLSAIIFRSVFLISVYSDWAFNVWKGFEVTPALALGAHIGNNMVNYGLAETWNNIIIYFGTTGWIIVAVFIVLALGILNKIGEKLIEVAK